MAVLKHKHKQKYGCCANCPGCLSLTQALGVGLQMAWNVLPPPCLPSEVRGQEAENADSGNSLLHMLSVLL